MNPEEKYYLCIKCGQKVKELYKVYNKSVLKLTNCSSCNSVADKYIEYDTVIIIIDLVLLNREAYRHVLFNTDYMIHWKLLIILELLEAYWELSVNTKSHINQNVREMLLDKFYTGDLEYYKTLFQVVFSNAAFFLTVFCLTYLRRRVMQSYNMLHHPASCSLKHQCNQVMKCITISSFGIFLFLPSLIWEKQGSEEHNFFFVVIYVALAQLVAYTVFCNCCKAWSILVILSAYGVKIIISRICDFTIV